VCDGHSLVAEPGEQRHAAPATRHDPPYLAVVVTARNDDHGGNLLGRMQTFVNALIGQARRHGLAMELIVVEWNPPPERPSLATALRWPQEFGPCEVRILAVPPEVHRRYKHCEALPLYQMIAKNVGIRRARARFILATNIDILFSDELWEFLAEGRLESGKLYRIDRHDVIGDVPAEARFEEQLSYCRSHLLRVYTREGAFPLTREGSLRLFDQDIAALGSGVYFGRGWYPVEQHCGRLFRWVGEEAEITVEPPHEGAPVLALELEPGPGVGGKPFRMSVLEGTGKVLAEVWIPGRSLLRLRLGSPLRQSFRLRAPDGGLKASPDPRVLDFRVLGCAWEKGGEQPGASGVEVEPHPEGNGLPIALGPQQEHDSLPIPAYLHINACGDFTLMAREHWFDVRGYPEFDLHSFNLDSVLCYAAYYTGVREEVLADPLRIYHMEHAAGSGWTPEGASLLFERLAEKGIPWVSGNELMSWAALMERFQAPMIFNRDNWGLAHLDLGEVAVWPRKATPEAPGKED